jgi:DNA-binding SARP family transcriptional activator
MIPSLPSARAPHLRLLRTFELTHTDTSVPVTLAGQRLLAFLALANRVVQRTYAAGSLWLDATDRQASARLRTTLWRLPRPGGFALVEATASCLRLNTGVTVDLWQRDLLAARLIDDGGDVGLGELDPSLFFDDVLPDWYDDWVVLERERYRQMRLHALEALCLHLAARRRYARALQAGLAAVAAEPLRESAHRAVISVHLAEGNSSEAARVYQSYRDLLGETMGLRPSAAMLALLAPYRRAARRPRGEVALPARPWSGYPADDALPASEAGRPPVGDGAFG